MEINGQVVSRTPASVITADTPLTAMTTFKDLVEVLKCRYLKRLHEVNEDYQQTMNTLLGSGNGEITDELRLRAVTLALKTMEFRRELQGGNSNALFHYGDNELRIVGAFNGLGHPKFLPRVRVVDCATRPLGVDSERTYFTGISREGDEMFVSFTEESTSLLAITVKNKNGRFSGCLTCVHPKDLMDKEALTPDMELYHIAVAMVMDIYR